MLWRRQSQSKLPSISSLDFSSLPVLTAEDLLSLLGLHNKLRNIKRLVGIDNQRFEILYQAPILQFCELAQLAPASADYHHTAPGGLISHTIGMVELALHERRKYELPLQSDPEKQQQQKHAWTYAVFVGALLHDVGKLITLSRFKMSNGQIYNAYDGVALSSHCSEYQVVFSKAPYKLHQRLSSTFFYIIPKLGQAFIGQHLEIMNQLLAFFHDDAYEWGSIGEIVRLADQQSVSDHLKLGNRKRFPNAPTSPLHERLITSLRQMIREGDLPINRAGAALWVKDEVTYLVSKVGADAMRDYIKAQGASDIPSDNLRLFDALQQFGYVVSTPSGKAIWCIDIRLPNGFNQKLTVLKFETNRLFHPSRKPESLKGAIHESEAEIDSSTEPVHDVSKPDAGFKLTTETESKSDLPIMAQEIKRHEHAEYESEVDEAKEKNNLVSEPSVEMGEAFIHWLRSGIDNQSITINDGIVHILNYKNRDGETEKVVGIISPRSFDEFARTANIQAGKPHEVVQKSVHKLKLAIKNGRFHIHKYRITSSPSAKAILLFYCFPLTVFEVDEKSCKTNDSLVFTPS